MIRGQAAWALSLFSLLCALTGVAACGDDGGGGSSTPTDAGLPKSGNGGGGAGGSRGPTVIPRRDAQVMETESPITACDRANPSCATGETCDILFRSTPDGLEISTGCVREDPRERAEGDPCSVNPSGDEPYEADGLKDTIFREQCGPGLVCAPNRKVRGAYSCQKTCVARGLLGESAAVVCEDPASLCLQATQFTEYCRKTEGCNVEKQTGCLGGESCYLIPSSDRMQLLGVCSATVDPPTADNAPGCSPASCNPGSVCLGPVQQPISAWTDTNRVCRPVCNGQTGEAPATPPTNDEDAGVPSGLCSATTRCQPYSASGLVLSSISAPPFGQCEAQ
jgi:hypothetical protein